MMKLLCFSIIAFTFIKTASAETWSVLDAGPSVQAGLILPTSVWEGRVVGTYITSDYKKSAFIYDGNSWSTFNAPLAQPGATTPTGIWGSNIVGTYTGTDYQQHAFLYNIIPEPSTYALFGLGIIGALLSVRRKRLC